MKKGFKDATAISKGKIESSPWNFDAPSYDERSSCFVNAGDHYGVGHRQPVGHEGNPRGEGVPRGRVNTLRVDKVPKRNLNLGIRE